MTNEASREEYTPPLLCPSAQPDMAECGIFGVIEGNVETPQVTYLDRTQPLTEELLALTDPVRPTEVFRMAAPCVENNCQHFDGSSCRLVKKVVMLLPRAVEKLPPCRIRPQCRWWQEEGRAACLRCPQIVTEPHKATASARLLASTDYESL